MSAQIGSLKFSGFLRRLIEEEHISAELMQKAVEQAKKNKQDIVKYLVEQHKINAQTIAEMISLDFGEPFFDLNAGFAFHF